MRIQKLFLPVSCNLRIPTATSGQIVMNRYAMSTIFEMKYSPMEIAKCISKNVQYSLRLALP